MKHGASKVRNQKRNTIRDRRLCTVALPSSTVDQQSPNEQEMPHQDRTTV